MLAHAIVCVVRRKTPGMLAHATVCVVRRGDQERWHTRYSVCGEKGRPTLGVKGAHRKGSKRQLLFVFLKLKGG